MEKKIIVFGYSNVGHSCLQFLLEKKEKVVCVYTHEDQEGENIWFPSVLKLAQQLKVPVRTVSNFKNPEEISFIKSLAPDLMFSFYYRNMLPLSVLNIPALGAYNMHGSYLPKFRGRAPVNWAVLHGEKQTGATLHVMTEKPDAGDIVDQESVPIGADDTSIIVQSRVGEAAVRVLARQIDNLKSGTAPRIPQNHELASYFGGRKPEDGKINWSKPAQEIHNLVRAVTHPYPGAFTDIDGKITYIWQSRLPFMESSNATPGEIIIRNDHLYVVCGDGQHLEILQAQQKGEPELSGAEFAKKMVNIKMEARGSK